MDNVFIPKIVHQIWWSFNNVSDDELPSIQKQWRQRCIDLNPDWVFKLWAEEDCRDLVESHYPNLTALYDNYDVKIKQIDMVRYLMLNLYGGLYLDMDMLCLRPFGKLLNNSTDFVVANQERPDAAYSLYPNAFMASPPQHKIFTEIFSSLPRSANASVVYATGPNFLTRILRETKFPWRALPLSVVFGHEWNDPHMCNSTTDCLARFPEAVTVSLWTHSWKSGTGRTLSNWV